MFDKIFDAIILCWERLSPLEILHVYQLGVVLRFGVYHRSVGPGLHWKWPIAEEVITEVTVLTTMRLPTQTLTTSDDIQVEVGTMVKYEINDMKEFVSKVWDQKDVLGDTTMGAIQAQVASMTYADLRTAAASGADKVLKAVRAEVNKYGFTVKKITFTDIGRTRSLRLNTRMPQDNLDN